MLFEENNLSVRILSVQRLGWNAMIRKVAPRPYHALSFRLEGRAKFTAEGVTTFAEAGDISYVPKDFGYDAKYTKGEIIVIHFDMSGYEPCGIENYTFSSQGYLGSLFRQALDGWKTQNAGFLFGALSTFFAILAEMRNSSAVNFSKVSSPSFEKAVSYMRDNFTDPSLTVTALSDIACMSTTYFRRMFFAYFSDTPSKYITRLRMEHAEKLLAEGNRSVEEVASLSGFNDSKYFCKVVKAFYGCPPSRLFAREKV